ncbi:MAG TPA: RNA 2',3'-cyclic phosphodiesterase [Bacteroidota bacterium]|nr:RNA 2',3'-cyclic phosphodiesterase [Candidatus Kapabacteria bacterium]HRS01310.1 RNA 2',3'-cyclic phosphodiesterase [Bacteroidota bacterium]HRT67602.1 RNA 2',3'-cyclic phosphodiesterase [Bacteroidota bacterium]
MRLFIGAFLNTKEFISKYLSFQAVASDYVKGKWVEPENLHFTILFLGNIDEEKFSVLKEKSLPLLKTYKDYIKVQGIMTFKEFNPNPQLVFNINNPSKNLFKLHYEFQSITDELLIPTDKKKFKPHLTLCRTKSPDIDKLHELIDKYESLTLGDFHEYQINFIESKLTPKGPIYKILTP